MINNLIKTLKFDEGVRNKAYKDSLGYWTIGVGHFIGTEKPKAMTISDTEIDRLLRDDLNHVLQAMNNIFNTTWHKWSEPRQVAVANMIFNLGETRFKQFRNTIKFIKAGDWVNASKNASKSLWAKQVGKRSERICYMLEFSKYPEIYKI